LLSLQEMYNERIHTHTHTHTIYIYNITLSVSLLIDKLNKINGQKHSYYVYFILKVVITCSCEMFTFLNKKCTQCEHINVYYSMHSNSFMFIGFVQKKKQKNKISVEFSLNVCSRYVYYINTRHVSIALQNDDEELFCP